MYAARIKFFYHIARGALSRLCRFRVPLRRRLSAVRAAYSDNYAHESNEQFLFKRRRFFARGTLTVLPVADYKRFLLARFAKIVEHFGAASVLELGSGRGLNLLALAILCPRLREAQEWNFFYRLYLKNIDYFCASYREVEQAGWRLRSFEVPVLQKFEFNTGILVCTPSL